MVPCSNLVLLAHGQNSAHIEFIERGQHGARVLCILQSLGNA